MCMCLMTKYGRKFLYACTFATWHCPSSLQVVESISLPIGNVELFKMYTSLWHIWTNRWDVMWFPKELSRNPAASSRNLLGPNCHVRKPKVAMWKDFTDENQSAHVDSPKELLDMWVRPLNTLHPTCQSTSQLNMRLRVNETLTPRSFLIFL